MQGQGAGLQHCWPQTHHMCMCQNTSKVSRFWQIEIRCSPQKNSERWSTLPGGCISCYHFLLTVIGLPCVTTTHVEHYLLIIPAGELSIPQLSTNAQETDTSMHVPAGCMAHKEEIKVCGFHFHNGGIFVYKIIQCDCELKTQMVISN